MSAGRCRACAETTCTLLQGDHDFIKPLLEEIGDVKFGRVALKPGKPATFASVKVAQSGGGGRRTVLLLLLCVEGVCVCVKT